MTAPPRVGSPGTLRDADRGHGLWTRPAALLARHRGRLMNGPLWDPLPPLYCSPPRFEPYPRLAFRALNRSSSQAHCISRCRMGGEPGVLSQELS